LLAAGYSPLNMTISFPFISGVNENDKVGFALVTQPELLVAVTEMAACAQGARHNKTAIPASKDFLRPIGGCRAGPKYANARPISPSPFRSMAASPFGSSGMFRIPYLQLLTRYTFFPPKARRKTIFYRHAFQLL